jgi:cysteinyl-tRNA synthetase
VCAVRDAARAKEFVTVLEACDALRDEVLPPLGVKLEDALSAPKTSAGAGEAAVSIPATWKLREPAELLREMEDRKCAVLEKQRQKEEAAARRKKEEEEKKAQGSIKPEDVFRLQHASKYSTFDEKGIPTHDAEGKALSDKARTKLQAVYDKQAKLHEWFLAL